MEIEAGIYDPVPTAWMAGIPTILPSGMDEQGYREEISRRWDLTPEMVHDEFTLACETQEYKNQKIVELITWIGIETHEERLRLQDKLDENGFLKPEINNA